MNQMNARSGSPRRPGNDCAPPSSFAKVYMATIPLHSDFKEFLRLLNSNRVEYLLMGGYAVIYHGYMRTTGDMDIWIAVNPTNAQRLAAMLE
jgi:hypothetical protein